MRPEFWPWISKIFRNCTDWNKKFWNPNRAKPSMFGTLDFCNISRMKKLNCKIPHRAPVEPDFFRMTPITWNMSQRADHTDQCRWLRSTKRVAIVISSKKIMLFYGSTLFRDLHAPVLAVPHNGKCGAVPAGSVLLLWRSTSPFRQA